MRAVFIGASTLAIITAQLLLDQGDEVVIIEIDRDKIDELSDQLDCGFVHADGTRPDVQREVSPKHSDVLFCLTDSDQNNILASLVGQALGFKRVFTKIESSDFKHLCHELGLENVIIPDREVAKGLIDTVCGGEEKVDITTALSGDLRFFTFVVEKSGCVSDLYLPKPSRVIAITREGESFIANEESDIAENDELVIIAHKDQYKTLKRCFSND